jgi:hypothetical protein
MSFMKQFDDCIYCALHFMSVIWEQLQIMYVYYGNSKNDTIYISVTQSLHSQECCHSAHC